MEPAPLTPAVRAALPPEAVAVLDWLAAENARLRAQVADLTARLNQNSSNSSKPPSADPPSFKPAPKARPTGRRPGGQPGHPRHRAPVRVPTHVHDVAPCACGRCGTLLLGADPAPVRRQVVEWPPAAPVVTEYRLHALRCAACGAVTRADPPAEATHSYGPRLQAAVALLAGGYRLSKRSIRGVCAALFGLEISTGQVCDLERQTAGAVGPAVEAARDYVRERPANVDETGWREAHQRRWLWVAVARLVAVFAVLPGRSRACFRTLMGDAPGAVVTTDRYGAYSHLPADRRQLCWAHLRRDFQALIDRGGDGKAVGEELLRLADDTLRAWKRVRDGALSRDAFRSAVLPGLRAGVAAALAGGRAGGCAKAAGACMDLQRWEPALWTFARVDGVEPTNNAAERALRHAVCWRKTSSGTASPGGSRFVERVLTVVASCRLQGRSALDFLTDSIRAARAGTPGPSLIPTAS